jgi:hypothetical protein
MGWIEVGNTLFRTEAIDGLRVQFKRNGEWKVEILMRNGTSQFFTLDSDVVEALYLRVTGTPWGEIGKFAAVTCPAVVISGL